MKTTRAILIGALIWLIAFTTFGILYYVPVVKDSINLQGLIVGLVLIPGAWVGARLYYRKGAFGNGLLIGAIMVSTALSLDALITVPFMSMPLDGMGHAEFFAQPVLWALVVLNLAVISAYWKIKVEPNSKAGL